MSRLSAYIRRDMRSVDGWLHPTSAAAIAELGSGGNAAEIGVHHGKLLILLSLLCDHAYAIDVFDSSRNTDSSGDGNREIFEANVRRYGGAWTTIQTDSALLAPERLPPIRIFSVDGAHTADMTEHDLRLASVYVHYRQCHPQCARLWIGEHILPKAGYRIKDPDAFLRDADGTILGCG